MNRAEIEKLGRLCERAMKAEASAVRDGNLLGAAAWADCAELWSMLAFDEAARA